MVGGGCSFLQNGIRAYQLAGYQILADAEVLQGTLRLRASEFIARNIYGTEPIGLTDAYGLSIISLSLAHGSAPFLWVSSLAR